MKTLKTIIPQILLSSLITIAITAGIVSAASTIGANISTDGTLSVTGATTFNTVAYTWPSSDGSASTYLQTDGSGALSWSAISSTASDWTQATNYGTANLTASTSIPYWAKSAIYASSTLTVAGNTILSTNSNTKVGIGTTSPYAKLSVTGFINTDQYSGYKQAGNTILYASSTNSSTLVGQGAGAAMESGGIQNTAVGYQALNSTTSGDYNTAIGYQVLNTNTSGAYNTAIGNSALLVNTSAWSNTAIGNLALRSNVDGSSNTAIGREALYYNASGASNNVIGYRAMYNNKGSSNVGIGDQAGYGGFNSTNIANGVFVGAKAGYALLTGGDNNIFLGYQSASTTTTGANNIVIGYDIRTTSTTASNELNIGNLLFGTSIDGTANTISSGNIGIATATPATILDVYTTATTTITADSNSSTQGGCLKIKDVDGGGYTYITVLNGVLTASQVDCTI